MKKKSKKSAIVKAETALKKIDKRLPLAKALAKQYKRRDLAAAEAYRDQALQNLKDAVLLYSAAEVAVADAYLEVLSAGNALGKKL